MSDTNHRGGSSGYRGGARGRGRAGHNRPYHHHRNRNYDYEEDTRQKQPQTKGVVQKGVSNDEWANAFKKAEGGGWGNLKIETKQDEPQTQPIASTEKEGQNDTPVQIATQNEEEKVSTEQNTAKVDEA